MEAIKFADLESGLIEGWGIPYSGPHKGKDIQGEYFSERSALCEEWFDSRPILYNHGLDNETKTAVVGRTKSWDKRDQGLWVQAQLDAQGEYFGAIKELVDDGKLFFSSGAMSHLVRKDSKSGEITQWPWVELSLTPTPANLYATVDMGTAKSHFKSAGLDVEELKAKMDAAERDALPDSDFAFIDSDGDRHLPINDAAHTRAALSRLDQTDFPDDAAKSAARTKIEAAAKKFGIDTSKKSVDLEESEESEDAPATLLDLAGRATVLEVKSLEGSYEDLLEDLSDALNPQTPYGDAAYSCIVATYPDSVVASRYEPDGSGGGDQTFWKIAYTIGDDGDPVLGKAQQVEQTYVPTKSFTFTGPVSMSAHIVERSSTALAKQTKELHERRIKEGRALSVANREAITSAVKSLDAAADDLRTFLEASMRLEMDQAKADALASPEAARRQLEMLSLFEKTL